MKRSFRVCVVILVLLSVLLPMISPTSSVAITKPLAGFTVAPAQLSFTIQPGAGVQTMTLTITNSYDISQRVVADLRSIDESGARLVPAGPVDKTLAQAIKLSATDITVPAQGTYMLQVAVDASSLSGGGHYASLVLTQQSNTTVASGFLSAVSINIFIIKNENIRTNLQLTSFHTNRILFSMPTSATATFRNLGNTHIVPRGSVSAYAGETLVAKSVLNTTSIPLFPDQQANFSAPFETYRNLLLPRKLQVRVMYRIDGSDIQLIREQTLWYVPIIDVIAVLAFAVIIWWRRRQLKKVFVKIRGKISRKSNKKSKIVATAPRATTKRILGRTVIRTHQAVSRSAARTSPLELREKRTLVSVNPPSVQKRIPVTIAEESLATPPRPSTEQSKAKKPVVETATEPKRSSKQLKTVKKVPKTATSKTPKKAAKAAPKKVASKPRKTTNQNKPSKTK